MNRGNKRPKLSRARPKTNVDINPTEHLLLEVDDHEDDEFEFDDEIVDNKDEEDKSRGIRDIYRDYLHTKRLKFDDYCSEQREYLRQLRQRCLELQQKRGCRFHIDPPVNRFADIPLGDPKWRICDPDSLPPVIDYTAEIWEYFNRFYFEPEQSDLSTLFEGICIYVNGYTNPIASHLHTLMLFTGGHYTLIFDRHRTTHTIATILSSAQIKSESARNKTVRPEWIIESLRAQKLLPLHEFLVHKKFQDIRETFALMTRQLEQQQQQQQQQQQLEKKDSKKFRSLSPILGIKNGLMTLTYETYEVDSDQDFEPNLLKLLNELDNDKHSTPNTKPHSSRISEQGPSSSSTTGVLPAQNHEPLAFNTSDYMPGSTQELDSAMLNELPDEIRREVIGYARQKQQKNNQCKTTSMKTSDKPTKSPVKNLKKPIQNNVDIANNIFFGRIVGMKANVCGKTSIQDVGKLFEEWICSTEELNDMDISYVIRFLLGLADEKRYEDLLQILYDMKECIQQNCNPEQSIYQEWQFLFAGTLCTVLTQESSIPNEFLPESLFSI